MFRGVCLWCPHVAVNGVAVDGFVLSHVPCVHVSSSPHAGETVSWFLLELAQPSAATAPMTQLFQSMLREDYCEPLRMALVAPEGTRSILMEMLNVPEPPLQAGVNEAEVARVSELHYQGVRLVRTLSKFHKSWLASNPGIVRALLQLWAFELRMRRLKADSPESVKNFKYLKLIVKTVMECVVCCRRSVVLEGGGCAGVVPVLGWVGVQVGWCGVLDGSVVVRMAWD